jgi:hypothetical protein
MISHANNAAPVILVVKQEMQDENGRGRKRTKRGRKGCKQLKKKPVALM